MFPSFSLTGRATRLILKALPLLFLNSPAQAQWQWATQTRCLSSEAFADTRTSATDAAGNVYLTGMVRDTVALGTTTLQGVNPSRFVTGHAYSIEAAYVAKVSPQGQWQWAVQSQGSEVYQKAIAVDGSGNVYVSGYYTDTLRLGPYTLAPSLDSMGRPNLNPYVAKLSGQGQWQWAAMIGSEGFKTQIMDLKTDAAGNVYVAGTIDSTARFGNLVHHSTGGMDGFVAKLSPQGQWQQVYTVENPGDAVLTALTTDPAGNVYVSGGFEGRATVGPNPPYSVVGGPGFNGLVAKLSAQGQWQWVTSMPTLSFGDGALAASLVYDPANDALYVAGAYTGNIPFGPTTLSTDTITADVFVARLNATNYQWQWAAGGGSAGSDDRIHSISLSANGQILVGGYVGSNALGAPLPLPATFGATTFSINGGQDGFIAALSPAGNWAGALAVGGDNYDEVNCVNVTSTGNVCLTGHFSSSQLIFDGTTLTTRPMRAPMIPVEGFVAQTSASSLLLRLRQTVGLPEEAAATFRMAPNPAHGWVRLALTENGPTKPVTIHDALGRLVRSLSPATGVTELAIDLHGLLPGIYVVRYGATARRLIVD